jgi:hypothetical protein
MLSGCRVAQQAGVVTEIVGQDLSDPSTTSSGGDFGPLSAQWLAAFAAAVAAAGLDPALTIVAPFNEIVGGSNAVANPLILAAETVLRQSLPAAGGWVTGVQGAYWDADADMPGDGAPAVARVFAGPQSIYEWHHYPNANVPQNGAAAYIADFRAGLAAAQAWAAANGNAVTLATEAGLWNPNDAAGGQVDPTSAAWPVSIAAMYAAIPQARPAPWAVTDGADPVNVGGSDATLPAAVLAAFRTAAATVQTAAPVPAGQPAGVTLDGPGSVAAGAPATVTIATSPPLAQVSAIAVSGAGPDYPFYPPLAGGGPFDTVPLQGGAGSYARVLLASGDFFKAGPAGGPYVDSAPVILTAVSVAARIAAAAAQVAAAQAALTAAGNALSLALAAG